MKTYKIRNKADGGILEVTEDQLAEFGLQVPNQMAKGGMIKRADGSYSRRGLWDNIRANKGSGKKPTKAMLAQEKKIRAAEKAYGGYMDMGGYMNPYMGYGGMYDMGGMYPMGGYVPMDMMAQGGINNPGFRALPGYVQENIIDNMAYGGCKECGGKMQDGGNLLPRPILNARLLGSGKTKQEANKYMQDYYSKAQDGKKLSKDQAYNKYAFQYTPSDERSNSPEEGYGYDNMYHGILMEKEGLSKDDALEVMERMGTSPLVEPNKIPDFLRAVEKTGYRYDEPYFSPYEREGILDYKRINPKTLTPKQPVGFIDEEARNGGRIYEAGDGKWIQEATKSIKKRGTEGVCTGSKFGGSGCPPGSKRYNLAKTFRKMAKSKKEEGGYAQGGEYEMTDAEIAKLRSMGYKIKEV